MNNEVINQGKIFNRVFEDKDKIEHFQIFSKIKIGVIGIGGGSGATFVSMNLAKASSDNGVFPCVIELGGGSIYDGIGMDKRFNRKEYFDFFEALENCENIRNKKNLSEGINWISKPQNQRDKKISSNQALKLINNAIGELIICDFSNLELEHEKGLLIKELLLDMDQIVVIIDPLPSKLLNAERNLEEIRETFKNPIYVINKFNLGINKNEMLRFLKINKPIYIPLLPMEYIYEAEYTCSVPFSLEKVKKLIIKPMEEILSRSLGD